MIRTSEHLTALAKKYHPDIDYVQFRPLDLNMGVAKRPDAQRSRYVIFIDKSKLCCPVFLYYVFFHEVGLWCLGHDKFARKIQKDVGRFVDETGPCELPAIPSQLIELQADSFAVIFTVNEWFSAPFGSNSIFKSAGEALRVWSIAMAFTFILFGQERSREIPSVGVNPHPGMLQSHPHPSVRLENVHLEAWKTAGIFSRAAISEFDKSWQNGMRTVAEVCDVLKIPSAVWHADRDTIERTYRLLCLNAVPLRDDLDASSRMT